MALFKRVACANGVFLDPLKFLAYIVDKLLLLQLKCLHLTFYLQRKLLREGQHFAIHVAFEIKQVHLKLPQLYLHVHGRN